MLFTDKLLKSLSLHSDYCEHCPVKVVLPFTDCLWEIEFTSFFPLLQTSDAESKLEGCLQKQLPEDAGSGTQVSGKCARPFAGNFESGRRSLVALTFLSAVLLSEGWSLVLQVTWSLIPRYFSESSGCSGFWKMMFGHCSHWNIAECDDCVLAGFQLKKLICNLLFVCFLP